MGSFDKKFDSAKQDWETPQSLFDKLNSEFHFDIDLAADINNAKCKNFLSKKDDALNAHWSGVCWLNPPYGNTARNKISAWVEKAHRESQKHNCIVVMLVPARTNTKWWHKYCMVASEVRFICGRPKFGKAIHGLPQPLAIIVFKKDIAETIFSSFALTT